MLIPIDVYHIPVSWSLAAAPAYTGSAYPFKAKHDKGKDRAKNV